MIRLFKFLLILSLASCSKENPTNFVNQYSGYYKVISVVGDTPLDLNNDGLKSTDLYYEISGPHNTIDGELGNFFDFDVYDHYLEIRPLEHTSNDAKFISFNFPDQIILYTSDDTPFLMSYRQGFLTYMYDYEEGDPSIKLININPDFDEKGELKSLEALQDGNLRLELSKEFFDFIDQEWIDVNATVIYQKVVDLK